VVCHCLRPKMVWTVWFQLVILSIVALFIIVMWDRLSYMDLPMFYGLACLSFLRISFSWIPIIIDVFSDWLLLFSKLLEYQRRICFRQYRIDFAFKKKKVKMKVIWPPIYRFLSSSSLVVPVAGAQEDGSWGGIMFQANFESSVGSIYSLSLFANSSNWNF
jgi:hypothetical protein